MRDGTKPMPGAIFVCLLFIAAIICIGVLRIRRFVPLSDSVPNKAGINELTNRGWPSLKIDINYASMAKLQLLPGIGPHLAERIVDYRRNNGDFLTLDDLKSVRGLGARSIERLKPYAVIGSNKAFDIAKYSPKQDSEFDSAEAYEKLIQD